MCELALAWVKAEEGVPDLGVWWGGSEQRLLAGLPVRVWGPAGFPGCPL